MQYTQISTLILYPLGGLVLLLCSFSQSTCPGGDCSPAEPLPPSLLPSLHGCSDSLRIKLLLRDAG